MNVNNFIMNCTNILCLVFRWKLLISCLYISLCSLSPFGFIERHVFCLASKEEEKTKMKLGYQKTIT